MTAQNILSRALQSDSLFDVVRAFNAGADLNARMEYYSGRNGMTYRNATPLFMAVDRKHESTARWLIENGADCAAPTNHITPLHHAAFLGMTGLFATAAAHGANLDITTSSGKTPMADAAAEGHNETVSALLKAGANPNAGFMPAMFHIVDNYECETLAVLLNAGSNIHSNAGDGTPCTDRWPQQRKALLENHQRNLNQRLTDGIDKAQLIAPDGTATPLLNHIIGAGKLQNLFSPQRWQGREKEGLKLYDDLAPAIAPYLRDSYRNVDLTGLSVAALEADTNSTAVGRYVRTPKGERGRV